MSPIKPNVFLESYTHTDAGISITIIKQVVT